MKKLRLILIFISALFLFSCAARQLQCNIHVAQVLTKRHIYLPDTNANGMDRYMASSPKWRKIKRTSNNRLNHKEAFSLAKAGKTVVVTYNTHNKRSGHIAVVAKTRNMYWSKGFNSNVPYASGSVNGKKPKITPLSNQFNPKKESQMNYFVYIG